MPEPISYILAKTAAASGGLFGGLAMLYFIKPTNLLDATVRGGVSTGSAIIGAAPLLMAMNANPNSWEMHLCAGAVIGFLSWGVLSMIARFFIKAAENNEDIVDAVKKFKK